MVVRPFAFALLWSILALSGAGCGEPVPEAIPPDPIHLFTQLPSAYTGVDFVNRLDDTEAFNVFTYRNYYDGGGIGLADVNGDSLVDIFLTANRLDNRLYLNEGDFRFRDVTDRAGVGGRHKWSTGVSIADVNGDGWLDIYVSNSGDVPGDNRANELFINQGPDGDGVPRFRDEAEAYGLADRSHSTHAAFFDFDRDGDLDLYLMNNTSRPLSSFTVRNVRDVRHEGGGDKLYRNDGDRFTDVSEAAGIYGSEIGFGLGVTVGDVNGDGWLDIYVSNDFFERDYLYINQQSGTFREELEAWMPVISQSSMGADMADLNNDARPEIYVTDMLPEDARRLNTTSTFNTWNEYQSSVESDFYHQIMRNTLQVNNGDGTFSELGHFAGVAATDWSWSALIADYDLDGHKDIFVANGIFRDLTDQDFITSFASDAAILNWIKEHGSDMRKLLEALPSTPLPNYAFRNNGNLTFTNIADAWGLAAPGFSNGSAYADLDNDGDLDLVVNNVNAEALVFRNEAGSKLDGRFLQVVLDGAAPNRFGIGAAVTAWADGTPHFLEQVPTRGFQSTVDPVLTFGLGPAATVDSLVVVWPDDRVEVRVDVPTNQRLTLRQSEARPGLRRTTPASSPFFADITDNLGLNFVHQENDFSDFDREPLLYKMFSTEGPAAAVGDVNGDGLDDLYLGGAKEQAGRLFIQQRDGRFLSLYGEVFTDDRTSEDVAAAFFDADGDGDQDLYVVSGGSEFSRLAPALKDRLYLNDGRANFRKAPPEYLPSSTYASGGSIAPADFDGDGDMDLFVGGRVEPGRYGLKPESLLLENDGTGRFTDVTRGKAPGLRRAGLVTDVLWSDTDGDGRLDLVVAGEWMPLTIFRNTNGRLERQVDTGLDASTGWWNRLVAADFDGDGDEDFVAGNLGLNTTLRATPEAPLTLYVGDFDRNGYAEQILAATRDGQRYPLALRGELVAHLPFLADAFPSYQAFAGQSVDDLFTPERLQNTEVLEATALATSYIENLGDGTFHVTPLPAEAQWSPTYGLLADDVDGDGHLDLVLAGNFDRMKPQFGRMAAGYGLLLRGDGEGGFTPVPGRESGLRLPGQTRHLLSLNHPESLMLAVKNDGPVQATRLLNP